MKNKKLLSSLLAACWLSAQASANQSPVDTLPQVDVPSLQPGEAAPVEGAPEEQAPRLQMTMSSVIRPAGFGIQGVKTLPFDEVSAIFAPHAGRSMTLGELVALSQQVTALYQQRGYPLSFCYIPMQDFSAATLRVVVVEGYVESVAIAGNPGRAEAKIREVASHLLAEKPLTRATMERYVALLSLLPGLKIKASLPLPRKAGGATELKLDVSRKPFDLVGRAELVDAFTRSILSVKSAGNTPLAEETTVTTLLSKDDEDYYAASHVQPIGSEGLMLRLDGSSYEGSPTTNLGPDIERAIRTSKLALGLSYPLLLTRNRNLTGGLALQASNFEDVISSRASGRRITTESDVRALAGTLSYTHTSRQQARRLQLGLTKGLDALGASKQVSTNFAAPPSENPVDIRFTKANLALLQKNYYARGWGTSISAALQYSEDDLPVTERVLFGGYQYGRAYSPGKIVGDSGFGLALELNRTIPWAHSLPFYRVKGLQPYLLAETARVYGGESSQEMHRIASATVGLRVLHQKEDRFNLDFSLSQAITGGDSRDFLKNLNFGVNFGIPM